MILMKKVWRAFALGAFALASARLCRPIELKVSREALERTLKQQLFNGPDGRYYLRGSSAAACYVYAEDPKVTFALDRIVVRVKIRAKLGTSMRGSCLGVSLSPTPEVSVAPEGEGETLGFKDARLEKISDQRELNFVLSHFLGHTVPSSMRVNAADLLRKALIDSTETSGYKVVLDRLKIHSIQIAGDDVVVDVDGGISVQ